MIRTIERTAGGFTVRAHANGKARCQVAVYSNEAIGRVVVGIDEINPVITNQRTAFVARMELNIDEKVAVCDILEAVAAELAEYRATVPLSSTKEKKEEPSPFPEIEPWEVEVDGSELLTDVGNLIARYVKLPPAAIATSALWTQHTYTMEAADFTPYLHVNSPVRECGKTTFLELQRHLAFRSMMTSGITAAALYRRTDRWAPTMLLDELDTRMRGENAEIFRGVLNSGFSRAGGVFTICVGDAHEEKDFKTFGPKILAGIGRLPDTITSRSIPVRLERASKEELATLNRIQGHTIDAICLPYRRKLKRWAVDNVEALRQSDPDVPPELGARQSDVWRPLLAIADLAGGSWPTIARGAAKQLHSVPDDEHDYGLLMLADVRDLAEAQKGASNIHSATIVEELSKREDRPWSEYRHDRPITKTGVAKLLKRFGISPTTVRVGELAAKGYRYEDLSPAFRRYLPLQRENLSLVTVVTEKEEGVPK
jgi:hypothetical protein